MIEMPSDMNGLLKSITRSRSAVIVIGAIAISASYFHSVRKNEKNITIKINWKKFHYSGFSVEQNKVVFLLYLVIKVK